VELFDYKVFMFYALTTNLVTLDRNQLRKKVTLTCLSMLPLR
jgi:hypothetical protein